MHQIKNPQGKFAGIDDLEKYIIQVCQEHKTEKRALVFALIIYDFDNPHIEKILNDSGYYNALDSVSGKTLTVFYIHSKYLTYQSGIAIDSNTANIELGVQKINGLTNLSPKFIAERLLNEDSLPSPSILFFTISENIITDYTIAKLRQNEIEKGFNELINLIKLAVDSLSKIEDENRGNDKEIFTLLKQSIDGSEFWTTAKVGFDYLMKLKDFFLFWKV